MRPTKILPMIILILVGCLYVAHFLFFWIFPSTDSHFYYLFADFLRTGQYTAPHPYYYQVPSTMEPPLYSVFLLFASTFTRPDILIHFVHLASIFVSGLFLYKILCWYFGSTIGLVGSVLFLLIPAHLIYSSNLVAEPLAVFYISLFFFLLHTILNERKLHILAILLPYAAIISLHRYNLLPYWGTSVLLVFYYLYALSIPSPRRRIVIGFILSLAILFGWVFVNYRLNGSWGFSNAEGKHLYNRVLHFDRLLPPDNNPSFVKFRSIVGEDIDYFKPWWFYEPLLMASLGTETAASHLMGEVSLSALVHNPLQYILHTPGFFLFAHGDNPTYHDGLYRYGETMKQNCTSMGTIEFCQPIIKTKKAFTLWDQLVDFADGYYLSIHKYINYFLLFPSLAFFLLRGGRFLRLCACLYLIGIATFVMVEAPLPRYTYIFTPLAWLLSFSFVVFLGKLVVARKRHT